MAFRLFARFSDDPNVDWAIWMNLVIAGAAGYFANAWLDLGWPSLAIAAGLFALTTAALWTRFVWLAAIIGTPGGAFVGGAATAALAAGILHAPTRTTVLVAAAPGALAGGLLTARAYARVIARRRQPHAAN